MSRMNARKKRLPDSAELYAAAHRLFKYMDDGSLVFKLDPRHPDCKTSKFIGKRVGGNDGHGYLMCLLLGHKFKVHQVVWLMHTGDFPKKPIDHINRNRQDNRIENLRLAEDVENMQNLSVSTKPSAGTYFLARTNRYCARITHKGSKVYLGYFDTMEEANAAYKDAKRKLSGIFSPV